MKTLILSQNTYSLPQYKLLATFIIILMLWWSIPNWLSNFPQLTFVDVSIWHLVVFGILLWLLTYAISSFAFHKALTMLGLPNIKTLILEFNTLTIGQKYILYYLLFTLWWLTLLLSLLAIL